MMYLQFLQTCFTAFLFQVWLEDIQVVREKQQQQQKHKLTS